jgi:hypothetical protein
MSVLDGAGNSSPLLNPVMRNWFRISQRATMIVIGLQKPYTKLESGANLYGSMMLIDLLVDDGYGTVLWFPVTGIEISGIHFQYQNNAQ